MSVKYDFKFGRVDQRCHYLDVEEMPTQKAINSNSDNVDNNLFEANKIERVDNK